MYGICKMHEKSPVTISVVICTIIYCELFAYATVNQYHQFVSPFLMFWFLNEVMPK
jgi:hypothetical protein